MFEGIEFSAEDKLILLSSNIEMLEHPFPPVILDIKNIDWDYIANRKDYLFFAPALYVLVKSLKKNEKGTIPDSYYINLKHAHYHTAISNLKLREQVLRICNIFKGAGVEIIFLKGAGFMHTIYKDRAGIRWIRDIDILVQKKDLRRSQVLLKNAGFKEIKYAITSFHHNLALYREGDEKTVEIHYHLLHSAAEHRKMHVNIDDLFRDSQKINGPENSLPILSPEDSLLYRCIDLVNRFSSPAHCILDISAIIYYYKNIDWGKITRKAFSWKAQFFTYRGLKFAKERAGVSVPPGVINELGGSYPFFYNLFPADQQISNHYYSIRIFIKDLLKTAKKYKNTPFKYLFWDLFPALDKKNVFSRISFIFFYITALILHLLRFSARGVCNLVKAARITHTTAHFLAVRYKNLNTGLNKFFEK